MKKLIFFMLLLFAFFLQNGYCENKISNDSDLVWETPFESVRALDFSPDSKYLAAGSYGVFIYDVNTGERVKELLTNTSIGSVEYSKDGKYLAAAGSGGIHLWDAKTYEELKILDSNELPCNYLCFTPDGKYLAGGFQYTKELIKVWDMQTGKIFKTLNRKVELPEETRVIVEFAYSSDKKYFVINGYGYDSMDRPVEIHILFDGFNYSALNNQYFPLISRVSDNGKYFCSIYSKNWEQLLIRDLPSGKINTTIKTYIEPGGLEFSPNSESIIIGNERIPPTIYEIFSGNKVYSYSLKYGDITMSIANSPDSKFIAIGCWQHLFLYNAFWNPNSINEDNNYKQSGILKYYPNPTNNQFTIEYYISKPNVIELSIVNILGNKIETLAKEYKNIGSYSIQWNIHNIPSGDYIIKLSTGDFITTKKIIINK